MDKFLARERNAFWSEMEIDRILDAFKLNPYEIMEVPLEADNKEITKLYRKKSLLIHPDKVKHREWIDGWRNCRWGTLKIDNGRL